MRVHKKNVGKQKVQQLSKELSTGNQKAFEQLFHIFNRWLLAASISIVREREAAEEIVQDVFFELWQKRSESDIFKSLESYLYVTVKNRSLDYYRKHSKRHFVEIEELNDPDIKISPEDIYLFDELKDHLDQAVAQLPPKCAEVFLLVKIEGNSHKKAGEILKISPKTVENQIGIAVKRIALLLETYLRSHPTEDEGKLKKLLFLCIIGLIA